MTKPELQHKYLLQAESPAVRAILQSAFSLSVSHHHFPERLGETDDERHEARRIYNEYCKELANYEPAEP